MMQNSKQEDSVYLFILRQKFKQVKANRTLWKDVYFVW